MNKLNETQVFTPPHIANQMLDLLDQKVFCDDDSYFFEPTVGDGNILIELLERIFNSYKINRPEWPPEKIFTETLYKFYACELDESLVMACRERVWSWFDKKRENLNEKLLNDYLVANQIRYSIEKRNTLDFLSENGVFEKNKVNQKRKLRV